MALGNVEKKAGAESLDSWDGSWPESDVDADPDDLLESAPRVQGAVCPGSFRILFEVNFSYTSI